MKLTKLRVESLPTPKTGQSLYWDNELRGFGVRVTPSGARSYVAQGRVNGKSRRITLGAHGRLTCDEARKKARISLIALDDGIDPQVEKINEKLFSVTLREVASVYIKERKTKRGGSLANSTKFDIQRHMRKSFGDWADKPIVNITRDLCSDRFSELSEHGPTQANQAFRILRALINYAMEAYRPNGLPIIIENPVKVISGKKMWNPSTAKNSRIPIDKIGAVWNLLQERRDSLAIPTSGKTGADIVTFLLLTGCRWSEAAELNWDHINIEENYWKLDNPKNHIAVKLPLSSSVSEMLKMRPRIKGNPYVFAGRSDGFIRDARLTMKLISDLAGLHLTPHDMRRTFKAVSTECHIELWKTKLLMNHQSDDVTIMHYTEKNDLRYLAREAEHIAKYFKQQGEIAKTENVVQLRTTV